MLIRLSLQSALSGVGVRIFLHLALMGSLLIDVQWVHVAALPRVTHRRLCSRTGQYRRSAGSHVRHTVTKEPRVPVAWLCLAAYRTARAAGMHCVLAATSPLSAVLVDFSPAAFVIPCDAVPLCLPQSWAVSLS